MTLFGIKFAPLLVPLDRRLQTLAVAVWTYVMIFGGVTGTYLAFYLVVYTKLRWIVLSYLLWVYLIDRHTAETGGRISSWVRSWVWWKYVNDYFPLMLAKPEETLDPKRNYVFACFPHGVLPTGAFGAFGSIYNNFKNYFPHHQVRVVAISIQFIFPFCRELILGLGGITPSAKSINHVLSQPDGGYIVIIIVGGARESYFCKPGVYRIVLKHRKGFVKLALRNGTPLVPVFSFGETELYDQFDGPRLRRIQEALRKWITVAPIIPIGRGFFQYSFGFLPRRYPVTTVVGNPIEVPRIENPTVEDVDKYHTIFMEKLTELFEVHKYKYLKNPENKHLIIE